MDKFIYAYSVNQIYENGYYLYLNEGIFNKEIWEEV